jgi:regulatory Fis family protein
VHIPVSTGGAVGVLGVLEAPPDPPHPVHTDAATTTQAHRSRVMTATVLHAPFRQNRRPRGLFRVSVTESVTRASARAHADSTHAARMKAPSAEAIARLMAAADARQTAQALLDFLIHANGAWSGAIFAVEGELRLLAGQSIDQRSLDWVSQSWARSQATLREGRGCRSDDRFLLPVVHEGILTALVYVAAGQIDLPSLADVAPLIVEAATGTAATPSSVGSVHGGVEGPTMEDIERRKWTLLLDRHEWNVSRVARELQTTRKTVYRRLEVLGIPRKRVAKGPAEAGRSRPAGGSKPVRLS